MVCLGKVDFFVCEVVDDICGLEEGVVKEGEVVILEVEISCRVDFEDVYIILIVEELVGFRVVYKFILEIFVGIDDYFV